MPEYFNPDNWTPTAPTTSRHVDEPKVDSRIDPNDTDDMWDFGTVDSGHAGATVAPSQQQDVTVFEDEEDDVDDQDVEDQYDYPKDDDDEENDDQETETLPQRWDGGGATYDDEFELGDNADDEFDPYDLDGEPQKPARLRKVLMALAIMVVVAIAGTAAYAAITSGGSQKSNAPATITSNQKPPADVKSALNQALTGWGKFSVDGDLNDVTPYFDNSSKQYSKFQTEAPTIKADPISGTPMTFSMADPRGINSEGNNTWIVRGVMTATRPGEIVQSFNYEIRLHRNNSNSPWLITSIRPF